MDGGMIPSQIGHIKPVMPNSIINPGQVGQTQQPEKSFSDMLKDSIDSVNSMQKNAQMQVAKLANGEMQDVHQVMTAMQEASLTFKLMMKVRGQILSAYKEITKGGYGA